MYSYKKEQELVKFFIVQHGSEGCGPTQHWLEPIKEYGEDSPL